VVRDATCPAVHTALQATEKGVPFMPLRGVLGSDLLKSRQDWKVSQTRWQRRATPSC
jgi:glutaconate CoA-transferase subunit A